LKANQPLTLEAVARSFTDPWTPRQRLVGAGMATVKSGAPWRSQRRWRRIWLSPRRSIPRTARRAPLRAGRLSHRSVASTAKWSIAVEYSSGLKAGTCPEEWAYALTSLAPEQADPARLERLWRGHWPIENGLQYVRDVSLGEDAC